MQSTRENSLKCYGTVVAISVLVLLLRFLLSPILEDKAPLLIFVIPVVVSAWYYGFYAGLFSTILCAIFGLYFFVEPMFSLAIPNVAEATRLTIFLAEGTLISWLSEALQRAKQKSDAIASSLQESEERYRLLINSVRDYAIFLLDIDGRIVSWNTGAETIKGYKAAEILGRHYSIFFTPEAIVRHHPEYQLQIAATEGRYEEENVRRRKDGSTFWANVILTPVRDKAGVLKGFTKVTRDISERKRAEEALRQEKVISDLERKRLQAVLDFLPVGVFVANASGEMVQANAMSRRIWGAGLPLAQTIDEYDLYKAWWVNTKQPIASHDWALARALMKGEVSIEEEIEIETFDGIHKFILNSCIPIRDEAGAIVNAVAVNVDITRLKQVEATLRQVLERLESLHAIDRAILRAESPADIAEAALSRLRRVVPHDQAVVMLVQFETQHAEILAGQVDHLPPGAAVALSNVMPVELHQPTEVQIIDDLATLETRSPLFDRQLNDGIHSCLIAPLVVENLLIGVLQLFTVPTCGFSAADSEIALEVANQLAVAIQQARLREQLQQHALELEQRVAERTAALQAANEELEIFAYSVAHDLRSPLRAIQGLGEVLLEDYSPQLDDAGQLFISRMITSASQMDHLITDLLDYSRLSRVDIELRPIKLDVIIADVLTQLQNVITYQQSQIQVDQPLPTVMGQRLILTQIITNLLTNSLKFTPEGVTSHIHIWAEAYPSASSATNSPTIRLWVEDNGIGIPPEHHDRIFRVFERLHGEESYPGTGIGLAIVRKGIERLGGQVGVESQRAQGSRFWIELPQASYAI